MSGEYLAPQKGDPTCQQRDTWPRATPPTPPDTSLHAVHPIASRHVTAHPLHRVHTPTSSPPSTSQWHVGPTPPWTRAEPPRAPGSPCTGVVRPTTRDGSDPDPRASLFPVSQPDDARTLASTPSIQIPIDRSISLAGIHVVVVAVFAAAAAAAAATAALRRRAGAKPYHHHHPTGAFSNLQIARGPAPPLGAPAASRRSRPGSPRGPPSPVARPPPARRCARASCFFCARLAAVRWASAAAAAQPRAFGGPPGMVSQAPPPFGGLRRRRRRRRRRAVQRPTWGDVPPASSAPIRGASWGDVPASAAAVRCSWGDASAGAAAVWCAAAGILRAACGSRSSVVPSYAAEFRVSTAAAVRWGTPVWASASRCAATLSCTIGATVAAGAVHGTAEG